MNSIRRIKKSIVVSMNSLEDQVKILISTSRPLVNDLTSSDLDVIKEDSEDIIAELRQLIILTNNLKNCLKLDKAQEASSRS